MDKDIKVMVGNYCRDFRTHKLKMTLHEVQSISNVKAKTLSNFENGRSGNLIFFSTYVNLCMSTGDRVSFILGLLDVFDRFNGTEGDKGECEW